MKVAVKTLGVGLVVLGSFVVIVEIEEIDATLPSLQTWLLGLLLVGLLVVAVETQQLVETD